MKISTDVLFAVFIGITLIIMFWALKPRREYKRLLKASVNRRKREVDNTRELHKKIEILETNKRILEINLEECKIRSNDRLERLNSQLDEIKTLRKKVHTTNKENFELSQTNAKISNELRLGTEKQDPIKILYPMDKARNIIDGKSLMNGPETPAHYNDVPITPNEYAEMVFKTIQGLTPYQFLLLGNIIKYVPRIGKKDDVLSTLKKIAHYANELVAKEEEKSKTP